MNIDGEYMLYLVSIEKGDTFFKQYDMDNYTYSRVNGKWKINTGGNPLNWRKVKKKESILLETKFQQLFRKRKLISIKKASEGLYKK